VYGGSIGVGTVITGSGVSTATVTSLIGGSGGVGTYGISVSQTVASTTISGTYSGTQTVKPSTSIGGSAVNITAVGSGNLTLTPVSVGITAPAGTSTSALATCEFVSNSPKLTSGTVQTAPPATPEYFDFTGIPSGVKRITVMFNGVSTDGDSNFIIQLGDAGGIETTGYAGGSFNAGVASYNTAGFDLTAQQLSTQSWGGAVTLTNITGNTWCESGVISGDSSGYIGASGGAKTLSATLDRVRVTTANGTDTFDAGSINIFYE
jgi:hypothetical protein